MISQKQSPEAWNLKQPYNWKTVLLLFVIIIILTISGHNSELDRTAVTSIEGIGELVGLQPRTSITSGFFQFFNTAFPLVLSERIEVSRLTDFNRSEISPFSYLESKPVRDYNAISEKWEEKGDAEYLVTPLGYLFYCMRLMLETLEIAIWGTLLSILISAPLAYFGAKGFSPNAVAYHTSRAISSFLRAVPELITAMFFVLVYGFGPPAGILALALHSAGFLGKFFADDIENSDRRPQEALTVIGVSKLLVLRYAVFPRVFPQFLAYSQYILERNVRTATILGIVGAGGIGIELKGRWDLSDFGHVSTILMTIFIVVFFLEHITQKLREKIL